MRDAVKRLGGDPQMINPMCPTDLVIDHSVQVDFSNAPGKHYYYCSPVLSGNAYHTYVSTICRRKSRAARKNVKMGKAYKAEHDIVFY